jgi:hypothetical protein
MPRTTAKSTAGASSPAKTPPVHTIRYRNLKASIWKNDGQNGAFYSVTLGRSYQDDQNVWHDVTSFNSGDLPLLAKLANDCHSWIEWQTRRDAEEAKRK